jgi:hypothetical protein
MDQVETSLRHPGTGRQAAVVRVRDLSSAAPLSVAAGKYVLVIACEKQTLSLDEKAARAWIDAGASYICAWGPDSEKVEEAFDYASFLPELGEPLPFTLMTTSHRDETPQEALWFAFYNAMSPDDLDQELTSIVMIVDSDSLETACIAWVKENTE